MGVSGGMGEIRGESGDVRCISFVLLDFVCWPFFLEKSQ